MTEQKAIKMGLKRTPLFERRNLTETEWRREVQRPACYEIWVKERPDEITRYRTYGVAATIITTRKA